MVSEAYAAGVLDAMVKSGEISPAYACGVFDEIEKQAQLFRTQTEDANRYLATSGVAPGARTDADYEKAIDAGTHWWRGGGGRMATYLGNRFRKHLWAPVARRFGSNMDDAAYDNELAQKQWAERMSRFKPDEGMDLGLAGYMQTKANQTTNAAILDNKRRGVSDAETKAQYGSSAVGQHWGTQTGNAALQSGAYKTDYEHAGPKAGTNMSGAGVKAQIGTPGSHRVDGLGSTDYIWQDGGRVG